MDIYLYFGNVYYYFVKIYTYYNYYCINIYNKIRKYFNKPEIIYVKNSVEYPNTDVIFDYDFCIYTYLLDDNKKTYSIFTKERLNNIIDKNHNIHDICNNNNILSKYIPKLSDCKFILIKIYHNLKIYDITNIVKDDNNYFYLVDNILFDKKFMEWFCPTFLNIEYEESMYVILFDNLMNRYELYNKNYITINENNFKIS
jgi:hypothetical protein